MQILSNIETYLYHDICIIIEGWKIVTEEIPKGLPRSSITKWAGSLRVTIPKEIVRDINLKDGDICHFTVLNNKEVKFYIERIPKEK